MTQPSPYFIRRTTAPEESDPADSRVNFFDDDEGRIDFNQYWRTIRKHLSMIVAIFVGVTALTLIKLLMETPMYTAEATILIKPGTPQIFGNQVSNNNEDSEGPSDDFDTYNKTQYEILKSRSLAENAIRNEGLEKVLSPNAGKPGLGWFGSIKHFIKGLFGRSESNQAVPVPHSGPDQEAAAIGIYRSELVIKPVPDTSLVNIVFTTPDGKLSAQMASAHAHANIRQGIELHSQANEEAQKFLETKLVELKEKLQKSEYALNRYRRDQGIVPGLMSLDGKETIVIDRLSVLSKDLTDAQVSRLDLESQVQMVRDHQYDALPQAHEDQMLWGLRTNCD